MLLSQLWEKSAAGVIIVCAPYLDTWVFGTCATANATLPDRLPLRQVHFAWPRMLTFSFYKTRYEIAEVLVHFSRSLGRTML